jgi:zinc/manganese transport system substrate-binding protein
MKIFLSIIILFQASLSADKLKVCATTSDLASLVSEIGGKYVDVTTFTPPRANPHNVIAKPNFIKDLSQADLFIQVGFDLEAGWVPTLLKNCRNGKLQPGQVGHLDPSNVIRPLFEKQGKLTRADGHVHPLGNPHYLMDPVNGLIVAHLITSRLKSLMPEQVSYFNQRIESFQKELIESLIGEDLAKKYPMKKLSLLIRRGKLEQFLQLTKQEKGLGGWLHAVKKFSQRNFIADHANYLYLVKRFDMEVSDYLEPKPGMTPTTSHLMALVKRAPESQVKGILTNTYFSAKYANIVSLKTKIPIVTLAHQVNAREDCETYLKMVDYNINQIVKVLSE